MATPFVGEVRVFAGNYAPAGWALCDGSSLSISENDLLFALIGTTYGGDGVQTFNLPDLRGRLPLSQGTGRGLSPRVMGQRFGSDNVTLLTNNLPGHQHAVSATTNIATEPAPGPSLMLAMTAPASIFYDSGTPGAPAALAPVTLGPAGGTLPHDNTMPTVSLNYIIALQGIYPQQG